MAATVEMKHKNTGESRWFYTVDAKEHMKTPGNPWKMTGAVKRSGLATPSLQSQRPSQAKPTPTLADQIAAGVVAGLAQSGVNSDSSGSGEVPEPASDLQSAGIPPENEVPGEQVGETSTPTDMLD